MISRLILFAALAAPLTALAQPVVGPVENGAAVAIRPTVLRGQAVMAISSANTSTAITSGLSLTVNSTAFPTATIDQPLTLEPQPNASVGVYVCWHGGTCSATVGEYLAPGQSRTVSIPTQNMTTQPPTVFSTGTPSVIVEW